MDAHGAGTSSTGRRARSGRRPRPPWWVVALGLAALAVAAVGRVREQRIAEATRAFHERHGPPPG